MHLLTVHICSGLQSAVNVHGHENEGILRDPILVAGTARKVA